MTLPSIDTNACPHDDIRQVPDDPEWGRCEQCGDEGFPLTAVAAGIGEETTVTIEAAELADLRRTIDRLAAECAQMHEKVAGQSAKLATLHTSAEIAAAEERGVRWGLGAARENVPCPGFQDCDAYTDRGLRCPACPRLDFLDAAEVCREARERGAR